MTRRAAFMFEVSDHFLYLKLYDVLSSFSIARLICMTECDRSGEMSDSSEMYEKRSHETKWLSFKTEINITADILHFYLIEPDR